MNSGKSINKHLNRIRRTVPVSTTEYSVTVDISDAPKMTELKKTIEDIFQEFYPKLVKDLHSENFHPPTKLSIAVKMDLPYPGAADGDKIYLSGEWFDERPDDIGCIIHEMTHIVQNYPTYDFPWIVEGIADYMRYSYGFRPENAKPAPGGFYTDGYRNTANFFLYLTETYGTALITTLNDQLRAGSCCESTFTATTGKNLDELWENYQATLK